jgi:hypothetical protein
MCWHKNPWHSLPQDEFILRDDLPFALEFNRNARPHVRLDIELMPEPFFGPRDAPVVVLLLNPGISDFDKTHHRDGEFSMKLRSDIASDSPTNHFHLSDSVSRPGHQWWVRACRELIVDVGLPALSASLLSVEFSPYHSKKFAHGHVRFPSQSFSFWLVEEAIKRKAIIVCMRGLRQWCGVVPALGTYSNIQLPKNARTSALSRRNLEKYSKLVKAIR